MPGLDYSAPLAAASGQAASPWGAVGGGAQVQLSAAANLRRGFNLDLGVMGMANVDASLSKFLTAEVTGEAHAQASLRAQVQMPMNLFGEIGLAVRLEAIAELAAGVQGSLGISVGDFVALVERVPGMDGLPVTLLRILLDEIDFKAGIYVKAALSAQAYAHLVIAGTAIANPARGLDPGFTITAGMGAGLKAGAGFRVFANLGVESFSRLVGRTIDVLVDEALDIGMSAVGDDAELRRLLEGARAPFKIGLRLAYELGDFLATRQPATDANGAQAVALRATQVILEESQRFLLRSMAEFGLQQLLAVALPLQGTAAWNAAAPQRRALVDLLRARPSRIFEDTPITRQFWIDAVTRSINVATALGSLPANLERAISAMWAATQLLGQATARVTRAQGSVSVIGLPPRQAAVSFSGPLTAPPPQRVDQAIRARLQALGQPRTGPLRQDDLLVFLADATLLDGLRTAMPGVDAFLAPFVGPLGQTPAAVAAALLRNIAAIVDAGGAPDSRATLDALSTALTTFFTNELDATLLPALRDHLAATGDARIMFDEVLAPSLRFAVSTVFGQALRWGAGAVPRDQLTEALSGVVMRLFGRSLVAIGDALLAQAQQEMNTVLTDAAGAIRAPGGIVEVLHAAAGGTGADEIAELVGEALLVGAEVFGPLPAATRAELRDAMYELVDMLPPDADEAFLAQLASADFVPQREAIERLAITLAEVGVERFLLFVETFLARLAALILEALEELVATLVTNVTAWINGVLAALEDAIGRLVELGEEIARLAAEVTERFARCGERLLESLATLRRESARDALIDELADETVDGVIGALKDTGFWDLISWDAGLKAEAKRLAKRALRDALDNDVVDDVLDAVGDAAAYLDDIVDDLKDLDPDRSLSDQLAELVLDRIEEAIDDALGDPVRIEVAFQVDFSPLFKGRVKVCTLEIDLDPLLDCFRAVARSVGAFEDAIRAAADELAAAFGAETRLAQRETERRAVESERDRLTRHADEAAPMARGVEIVAPALAQVVDQPARIELRILGATESLVESNDEVPPRIKVLLNQHEMDLGEFEHWAVVPPGGGFAGVGAGGQLRDVAGLRAGPRPATTLRAGKLSSTTDAAKHGFAATLGGDTALARGAARRTTMPAAKPQRGRASGRWRGKVERGGLDRARGGGSRPVHDGRLRAGPVIGTATRGLGKPIAGSASDPQGPSPTLRLRRPLLPSELREGLNTLALVVVWPSGQSMTDAVTFVAQPGASVAPEPAPPNVARPGRDGKVTPSKGRRLLPAGLLVTAAPDASRLPPHTVDPAKLRPKKPLVAEKRLALPPAAERAKATNALVAAAKKVKVDPSKRLKTVSPSVAARPPRPPKRTFPPVAVEPTPARPPRPVESELPPDPFGTPRPMRPT